MVIILSYWFLIEDALTIGHSLFGQKHYLHFLQKLSNMSVKKLTKCLFH